MVLLRQELIAGIETTSGLQEALQNAIRLEHATIPPYLYAVYSLEPGKNAKVAELIGSVVKEEMAHFALACNVLNAIGGEPEIDNPKFLPSYPGPLPGAVEEGLTLIEKVFMVIEQPEEPLEFPDLAALAAKPLTIGAFYEAIKKQIEAGGEALFKGQDRSRQVHGGIALPEVIEVHSVGTAVEAIESIVEQGEGTTTSPTDHFEGEELAHYYRFAEIVHGHELVRRPGEEPPWAYAGEPIPFEPSQVRPVVRNPTASAYKEGTEARRLNDSFNYTYTALLKSLHETFNGSPPTLPAAVGLMESMNEQAQTLMTIEVGSGEVAGPSFEYRPTNP
jgi:rubrerythrin